MSFIIIAPVSRRCNAEYIEILAPKIGIQFIYNLVPEATYWDA